MDTTREAIRTDCLKVYGFLLMLGRGHAIDSHESKDIASEAFVRVWANAEDYRENTTNGFYGESSKPWLFYNFLGAKRDIQREDQRYKGAHFSFSDIGEQHYLESRMSDNPAWTAESPQELAIKRERLSLLDEALAQLAEPHKEAIRMVYYGGMLYAKASEALGIEENILRMRVHRAKQSLRRRLVDDIE